METVTQLISESKLSTTEKQEAKADLESIIKDNPGAESAARRTHGRLVKVGGTLRAAYDELIVPLAAETLARIIKNG